MKLFQCLAFSTLVIPVLSFSAEAGAGDYRTWTDAQGRKVEATFRGVESGNVFLQTRNGYVHRIPLERLVQADRELAATLKPAGLGIPSDPLLAQAAARVDEFVNAGLQKAGQKPNPLASDEQFCRRVYLDIAGRIPTREEAEAFLQDGSVSKRAKLIDRLLESDGYKSHLFNYLADMLRIADEANKGRFYTYQDWLKERISANTPWDKLVHEMLTADGRLLDNGATGYLLRDAGMRLDNLSLTLSTFLGANVACAQCHDHPFADWTQRQFYEMAAFMGATETIGYRNAGKGEASKEMRMALRSIEDNRLQQQAKNVLRINGMSISDGEKNELVLPDDYKYKDGKPGDKVEAKLVTWDRKDTQLRAYQSVKTKEESELRNEFAKWMTAADNPRFAMTMANRMWKRAFGVGVREPVTDLDDPEASVNPALLHHLTAEMKRLKFDLKAFTRLICNTQAYQREATTHDLEAGTPYLFPGPVLRRMSAEQAWDSCVALAVGPELDAFKSKRGAAFAEAMNVDTSKPEQIVEQIQNALMAMRKANAKSGTAKPGKGKAKKGRKMEAMEAQEDENGVVIRPPMLSGLVLARASELPQPERDQHFLRQFGQSDRQLADDCSTEGSIPQVLMLMNGEAQRVIGSNQSLVVKTAVAQASPEAKVESLYTSFFTRKPTAEESAAATAALADGMGIQDLAWVLFNTREFVFVE
jgi:hypothetical protein